MPALTFHTVYAVQDCSTRQPRPRRPETAAQFIPHEMQGWVNRVHAAASFERILTLLCSPVLDCLSASVNVIDSGRCHREAG